MLVQSRSDQTSQRGVAGEAWEAGLSRRRLEIRRLKEGGSGGFWLDCWVQRLGTLHEQLGCCCRAVQGK